MSKKRSSWIISVCLIWTHLLSTLAVASQSASYKPPKALQQDMEKAASAFENLAGQIDKKYYDVDALAESLDFELDQAVNFVKEKIHYSPYLGVMRGPKGTLSTESGSSWDQAVLLAALINAMGGEAMLARGKLSEEDSIKLLSQGIVASTKLTDTISSLNSADYFQNKLGYPVNKPSANNQINDITELSYEKYSQTADLITANLMNKLGSEGVSLKQSDRHSALEYARQLGREYVWVRYRDTPGQPWREVHPAYSSEEDPRVVVKEYIDSQVPEELLHKISLQFYIETERKGRYKKIKVSEPYERPAANLAELQIQFGISPNTFAVDKTSAYYTPVIDGKMAPQARAFTVLGQTLDPEDAAAGPEIFATVGNKWGDGMTGLENGSQSNATKLSGVFLSITHTAPGGKKITEERRLTDFRSGMPKNHALEIVSRGTMEVDIGLENSARDYTAFLNNSAVAIKRLPYIKAMMHGEATAYDMAAQNEFTQSLSHNWLQVLSLGHLLAPKAENGRVVRTSPLIMIKRDIITRNRKVQFTVDIQHNRVRGFALDKDGMPVENKMLALRQGVLETLVEGELIGVKTIKPWKTEKSMRLIRSEKSLKADPIWNNAPELTKDRLLVDLSHSGLLLVPNGQSERWWRLDPNSGVVLGMGSLGGSEFTEELIGNLTFGFSLGMYLAGLASGNVSCMTSDKSPAFKKCCVVGNFMVNTGLLMAGGLYGAAAGWQGGLGALASISFDVATGIPQSPLAEGISSASEMICDGWAAQ